MSRLDPGRILMTAAVSAEVPVELVLLCVARHVNGDHGDTCPEDVAMNRAAIREGCGRVMSEYRLPDGSRLWVSTDGIGTPDHHTLALRPSDY